MLTELIRKLQADERLKLLVSKHRSSFAQVPMLQRQQRFLRRSRSTGMRYSQKLGGQNRQWGANVKVVVDVPPHQSFHIKLLKHLDFIKTELWVKGRPGQDIFVD